MASSAVNVRRLSDTRLPDHRTAVTALRAEPRECVRLGAQRRHSERIRRETARLNAQQPDQPAEGGALFGRTWKD